MKSVVTIIILIVSSLFSSLLGAQDNPYWEMAGKPYRLYYRDLERQLAGMDTTTPDEAARMAGQMREVARRSGDKRWLLEADYYLQLHSLSHALYVLAQKGDLKAHEAAEGEKAIAGLLPLLERAKQMGAVNLNIRIANQIMGICFTRTLNYEMGFRYSLMVEDWLSKVSAKDFPTKSSAYLDLERWYNRFGEYEKAESLCHKVIEEPAADELAWKSRLHALNDLGSLIRNHAHDLNRSDSCFFRILATAPPDITDSEACSERDLWSYIAKGQLGTNSYLRGDHDSAIPLLAYAVERIAAHNPYNYSYTAGKALLLADIYIKRNELPQAKRYLDSAHLYIQRAPEAAQWHTYYPVLARYYGARGDSRQALAYMDSTLNARNRHEEEFNLRKLHLAEQRVQQEKLDLEKLRSEWYRRSMLVVSVFLSLICFLLSLLYYYVRKKKTYYRNLVQKNRQWADRDLSPHPTEKDAELTVRIHEVMTGRQLYRNSTLTLDTLARLLEVNRETVSRAINRSTGKNFTRFLNEYRIKEAIHLLSAEHRGKINFDELSEQVGFNNRTTFHRTFKQITGLPPNEFRKKIR